MAKLKALSRGTQIVLVAGPLLVFSLFFTWQNVPVDYGPAGIAPMPLDGWDVWGLLLAVVTIATVAVVATLELSEIELSEDTPWTTVTLALGASVLAVAVLKSLTDSGSTWESYAFVALAGAVAFGNYLDWATARRAARPVLAGRRRGISSAV